MLKKPCVRSGGHIFSLILLKLVHNICLGDTLNEFENGSCGVSK